MRMRRRLVLAAAILGAGLVGLTAAPRPAGAVPAYLRGSYFGQITTQTGNRDSLDLAINIQERGRLGGVLSVAGRFQNVPFKGTVSARRFTLRASSGQGQNKVNIRVDGSFVLPVGDTDLTEIIGLYQLSGAQRERGSIAATGITLDPPDEEFRPNR